MGVIGKISSGEALSLKVGHWINSQQGFETDADSLKETTWLRVYCQVPRSFFFLQWSARLYVATVHLGSEDERNNWVLKVAGRTLLPQFERLGQAMATKFSCHVHIKLVAEQIGMSKVVLSKH